MDAGWLSVGDVFTLWWARVALSRWNVCSMLPCVNTHWLSRRRSKWFSKSFWQLVSVHTPHYPSTLQPSIIGLKHSHRYTLVPFAYSSPPHQSCEIYDVIKWCLQKVTSNTHTHTTTFIWNTFHFYFFSLFTPQFLHLNQPHTDKGCAPNRIVNSALNNRFKKKNSLLP